MKKKWSVALASSKMARVRAILALALGAILGVALGVASSNALIGILTGLIVGLYALTHALGDEKSDRRESRIDARTKRLLEGFSRSVSGVDDRSTRLRAGSEAGAKPRAVPAARATQDLKPQSETPAAIAKIRPVPQAAQSDPAPPPSDMHREWAVARQIVDERIDKRLVDATHRSTAHNRADHLPVAILCDEFTYNGFSPEFDAIIVNPEDWREKFEARKPVLFLCESAWSGVDSERRPWRGQIYGSVKFPYENRTKLFEILAYCKQHGIPTAFWNKEDPTHYSDRVNDFVDTARHFDYVFTTAEECVPSYQQFMGDGRVHVLPFAAQPRQFSPLPIAERAEAVVFAGAWYRVHAQRSEVMRKMFDAILAGPRPLEIFDRNFNVGSPDLAFPDEYRQFTRPAVPHHKTAELYRKYVAGLNVNTVTDSRTMFARRVFEMAASGLLILTNESPGIREMFGDSVVYVEDELNSYVELSDEDIASMTRRALEIVLRGHTYRHRYETILSAVGLDFTSSAQKPTMLSYVSSHDEARTATALFRTRVVEFSRHLMVIGRDVPAWEAGEFYTRYIDPVTDVVASGLALERGPLELPVATTPDLVAMDLHAPATSEEVERMTLHGAYTYLPVRVGGRNSHRVVSGQLSRNVRLTSAHLSRLISQPSSVQPILEV